MQVHDQKLDSGKAWERTYTKGAWSRQWLHALFVMGMSHSAARGSKVTFQKIYLLYKHFSITRFVSSAHILTCSWRSSFTTAASRNYGIPSPWLLCQFPNNAIHSWKPVRNHWRQLNKTKMKMMREWTVVKRKKPCNTGHVPKKTYQAERIKTCGRTSVSRVILPQWECSGWSSSTS